MERILSGLSDRELADAIEGILVAFLVDQRRSAEVEMHDGPELIWYVTGMAYRNFNRVVRAQFRAGDLDGCIKEALAPFRSRRVPLIWHTGPGTQPAGLEERLSVHGLVCLSNEPGMALDLSALPEEIPFVAGLTIEPVRNPEAVREWCTTAARSFGMPDWVSVPMAKIETSLGPGLHPWRRLYLGRVAGCVAATSLLFLGAGVAGLYSVTTLPEARRRGIGEAMTVAPLLEARAEGYRIATLHASPLGVAVYRRLGFEEFCRLSRYGYRD